LEKEKIYPGEISQNSSSAISLQISCFAAEIFYWYWKVSFSGKIGQFFVYNFANKVKIEISRKRPWRKRRSTA